MIQVYYITTPTVPKLADSFYLHTNLSKEQLAEFIFGMKWGGAIINEENLVDGLNQMSRTTPSFEWVRAFRAEEFIPMKEVSPELN